MNRYSNRTGRVTDKGLDFIEIDSVRYPITTPAARERIYKSQVTIDDRVEFNTNSYTWEIIFMKNLEPHHTYHWNPQGGYSEDPNDPDEVHDMEAVYGHSFEGM